MKIPTALRVNYLLAAAINFATVFSLQAAPVTTEFPGVAEFSVPVATNDLLQTNLTSVTLDSGTINGEGTTNLAVLYNGTFITSNPQLLTPQTGAAVRFTLDTSASPNGYIISQIDSYAGWNDSGRDRQTFTIEYSKVSAPGTFLPVDSVDFDPANADGGESASRAGFTTAPLINVAQLRFTFGSQENGHVGYGEFDVFGIVPEPSSAVLLGLGAVGLIASRRRRALA